MEKQDFWKISKKIDLYWFLKKIDINKLNKNNSYILENCEVYENKKVIWIKMTTNDNIKEYKNGIELNFDDILKYEFLIIKFWLLQDYSGNIRKKTDFDIITKTWIKNEKNGKIFINNIDVLYNNIDK